MRKWQQNLVRSAMVLIVQTIATKAVYLLFNQSASRKGRTK
ncbi:hypothetical protein [Limosilactobacillus urinaemulieris]|nr:hypothetical protein [Limosilactobacillus urinaemulieris]